MKYRERVNQLKYVAVKIVVGLACICLLSCSFSPTLVKAETSTKGVNATPLEYKIAKNFSDHFCEVLADGLSPESAGEIASNEIYKVFLSPSVWAGALFRDKNPLEDINTEAIDRLATSMVARNCRRSAELTDEDIANALNTLDELDDKLLEQANPR